MVALRLRSYGAGQLSRRVGTQKRISPVGKRVEDEGDLEPMARAEALAVLW